MWTEYGWLVWVLLGGLFLWFMMRGGGCCGGHGSAGGHGGRGGPGPGGHGGHEDASSTSPTGGEPRKHSHGGCH